MKFEEFMESYNNCEETDKRIIFVKEHIVKSYIPLEEKDVRSQIIINNSYYDENGNFKINSTAKHMFTFLSIVDMYTDIDIDFKDGLNEYNQLDGSGTLRDIISIINKVDLDEFKDILTMKCEDFIMNEYDIHHYINQQVERFSSLFGTIVAPALESIDMDKVQQVIDNVVGNHE